MLTKSSNPILALEHRRRAAVVKQTAFLTIALFLAVNTTSCKSGSPELQGGGSEPVMDKPLTTFNQQITSATRELTVSPGGRFEVPVTITNPTYEAWSSSGRYPVNVSYKWFDNGVMLPIEGDRTILPTRVPPGGTITLTVKGTAPQTGQKLLIKITLVQEAVDWFMFKGAPSLEIPVHMER